MGRNGRRLGTTGRRLAIAAIAVSAGGCSMVFDTPSMEGVSSTIPERILGDLASVAAAAGPEMELKPGEVVTALAKSEARRIAQKQAEQLVGTGDTVPTEGLPDDWSDVQRRIPETPPPAVAAASIRPPPSLTVERTRTPGAQLVVEGMTDGTVTLDGEPIGLVQTQTARVFALTPGDHAIRVEYVNRPPFSAQFYIDAGERITLRESN